MDISEYLVKKTVSDPFEDLAGGLRVQVNIIFPEQESLEIDLDELNEAAAGLSGVSNKIRRGYGYYDETFVEVEVEGERLANSDERAPGKRAAKAPSESSTERRAGTLLPVGRPAPNEPTEAMVEAAYELLSVREPDRDDVRKALTAALEERAGTTT